MDSEIVWNLDVRARPELEVDIDIVCAPQDIPGEYLAAVCTELEVEISIIESGFDEDAWFVADDAVVPIDDETIYDAHWRAHAAALAAAS